MKFGKRFCQAVGLVALGALFSTAAIGQVTSRFVVPGGAATTSKTTPGGTFSFEFRVDAPATQTIGAAFRLIQTAPATPPVAFQLTARDFTGSIYNDTSSGTPDATVLALPSALLNPDNDDNLGRNTIGLAGATAGTNLFVEKLTFSVDPATPLGSYTIQPTAGGTSAVTDTAFNDYDMQASGAQFVVVVGQPLNVAIAGNGTGNVVSDVGAISCTGAAPGTGTCSDIYPGSVVTLTATPTGGSTFTGWSGGGCSGTGTCVVTVSAATNVTATFTAAVPPVNLTVTLAGAGTGTVTSVPAGINCPGTCVAPYAPGTMVTLTATPTGGSSFTGWSGGGCSGTGTCVVTMAAATAVTATFGGPPQTLTVTLAGTGTGTVTSAPAGISCPGTCAFAFAAGSSVTLTHAAAAGSTFTGWSGACSGTGACVVTMSAAMAVTATFDLPPTTTITGMPTNPSSVPNPQFTFTSSIAGSTFQCSLDGGATFACSSPTTVSVGNGSHTFKVQAIGPGGNLDPVGATYTWTAAGIVINNPIPTLNEWMLLLLALMLGAAGMVAARRKA
jgi:hypothetical protein